MSLFSSQSRNVTLPIGRWRLPGLLDKVVLPINVDGVYANQDDIAVGKIGQNIVKILTALINRQELAGGSHYRDCSPKEFESRHRSATLPIAISSSAAVERR
jgi:hypothetical protein